MSGLRAATSPPTRSATSKASSRRPDGRAARGLGAAPGGAGGAPAPLPRSQPEGPDASHLDAQDRVSQAGKKLSDRGDRPSGPSTPFDLCAPEGAARQTGQYPKGTDNFRWRYHGLFYVAPNQDSFMCRLRIPNGILRAPSVRRRSRISRNATAAATPTSPPAPTSRSARSRRGTRSAFLEGLYDLGLTARGRGADNIRNVTGSPTAGIDAAGARRHAAARPRVALPHPQRPLPLRPAAQVQRRLRRRRPRPGAGGDQRHRLPGRARPGGRAVSRRRLVPRRPRRHHRPQGSRPGQRRALPRRRMHAGRRRDHPRVHRRTATAPTARRRGMKYVLDAWGHDRYLAAVEEELGRTAAARDRGGACEPRPPFDRMRPYRRPPPGAGRPELYRRRACRSAG